MLRPYKKRKGIVQLLHIRWYDSHPMKRLPAIAILLGILALSACNKSSPAGSSVNNVTMNGQSSSSEASFADVQAKAQKGDPEAMFELGAMYHDGDGVAKDLSQAAAWFTKAAQAGVHRAEFNLGMMYLNGEGVPKDPEQAVQWITKAAAGNNARANWEMGVLTYTGQGGVPQDFAKARSYFETAAMRGLGDGAFNLAVMNVRGEGDTQNLPESYAWFDIAKLEGYAQASVSLNTLTGQMTPEQITQGKARSQEIQKKLNAEAQTIQMGK